MGETEKIIGHKQATQFLTALERAGLDPELASKATDGMAGRIASEKMINILLFGNSAPIIPEPREHQVAREIMGENFFGFQEAFDIWRAYYPNMMRDEHNSLQEIPYERKTLEECAKTHVLVLHARESYNGVILTIENMLHIIIERIRRQGEGIPESPYDILSSIRGNDYEDLRSGWALVAKNISPVGTEVYSALTFENGSLRIDHQKIADPNHRLCWLPSVSIYFYILCTCYYARNMRLLENELTWTSTSSSSSYCSCSRMIGTFKDFIPTVKTAVKTADFDEQCSDARNAGFTLGVLPGRCSGRNLKV